MLIKAVSLFLIFMLVLGMFGKLRMPKVMHRKPKQLKAVKCAKCGAINAENAGCPCGGNKGS